MCFWLLPSRVSCLRQHWQSRALLDVKWCCQLSYIFAKLPASACHHRLGDFEPAPILLPFDSRDGLQFSFVPGSAAVWNAALIHAPRPWSRRRKLDHACCYWGPFKWYRELEQPRLAGCTIVGHNSDAEPPRVPFARKQTRSGNAPGAR